jgi:hypothetical protein
MIKVIMGLECKRDTVGWGNSTGGGREMEKVWEMKRFKICYIYVYGDSIKKPTKILFSKVRGGGVREYNRGGKLAQNILYVYIELSHEAPL